MMALNQAEYTEQAFRAYIECAVWASTDDDGAPLDGLYGVDDIHPESLSQMREDVTDFIGATWDRIQTVDPGQAGHDFWLTRNHHGVGFWDRGLGELGDYLTKMSHPYGECYLYVGDDGAVYVA